jgi:hypothetical protein
MNVLLCYDRHSTQNDRNPTCRQPESQVLHSSKLTENRLMSENQDHGYLALVAQEDRAAVS